MTEAHSRQELTLSCQDEQRRHQVRNRGFNGLDYLEVSDDQRTLTVYFLAKAPQQITTANIRIDGGRRITGIKVIDIRLCIEEDPELDDCMKVTVDRPGDSSIYTICLVEADEQGRPGREPLAGFDPRYACLDFSFKVNCPSDLDCRPMDICPPEPLAEPEINYLAKDYASFRQLMLDRLALIMPGWTERHVPDGYLALIEILAYTGDHLSYYQDAVATESYLETARQRISVRRHARLVDYAMHEGCNARTWLHVKTSADLAQPPLDTDEVYFITGRQLELPANGPSLTPDDLYSLPTGRYEVFEPLIRSEYLLRWGDFLDPAALAVTLRAARDPLSLYLQGQFSPETRQLLREYDDSGTPTETLYQALLDDLNRALAGSGVYQAQRFDHLTLSQKLRRLIEQNPQGPALIRLNRLLLEAAYSGAIRQSENIYLYADHNKIRFYTWGDQECCLPRGATTAALRGQWAFTSPTPPEVPEPDEPPDVPQQPVIPKSASTTTTEAVEAEPRLHLRVGDILIFEEVIGPKTGNRADADTTHRHPVRLTRVTPGQDWLYDPPIPVVEIEWAAEDALPFPLCISAIGPAPACELLVDISVARGNILLVDHGRRIEAEPLGSVPIEATEERCGDDCHPAETVQVAGKFRPHLQKAPLSFSQPLPAGGAAAALLTQAPRQALPQVDLNGVQTTPDGDLLTAWTPEPDLLGSAPDNRHFVVEMDNQSRAYLRFGDGELGWKPEAGTAFSADYRVGNGPAGNIGAEAISHMVLRRTKLSGVAVQPRNPLPAQGGTAPEPLAEVKLFAPYAFRAELQRAITAKDYARLAERHPGVQRAAATLRWTGSWYEVLVAIDPLGQVEADEALLNEIHGYLYRYRRMGHEVMVVPAYYVPLDIELTVCVLPHYLRGHVKAALLNLFSNRLLPDGQRGFFHPDDLTFGEGIYLSRLVALAQAVSGVESVIVTKLERRFEGPNGEIKNGLLPLGPMEVARLDNDPSFPENGRLKLNLRGGR